MDIFKNIIKDDCCGCGSCSQSCSKNAIKMTDEAISWSNVLCIVSECGEFMNVKYDEIREIMNLFGIVVKGRMTV